MTWPYRQHLGGLPVTALLGAHRCDAPRCYVTTGIQMLGRRSPLQRTGCFSNRISISAAICVSSSAGLRDCLAVIALWYISVAPAKCRERFCRGPCYRLNLGHHQREWSAVEVPSECMEWFDPLSLRLNHEVVVILRPGTIPFITNAGEAFAYVKTSI
jgi:hypothetical protein